MNIFFDTVIKKIKKLKNSSIIFPNQRAGYMFSKYIQEKPILNKNNIKILSIENFLEKLSDLKLADNIKLIDTLYNIQKEILISTERFEKYYPYGLSLINDFSDVDSYLINHKNLFKNIYNLKNIENELEYLTQEQINIIKSFWNNFSDSNFSTNKDYFVKIWDKLSIIYKKFQKELLKDKIAYKGLLYKNICYKISSNNIVKLNNKFIIAGFSNLNPAEKLIFKWLKNNNTTEILWDIDKFYFNNNHNEASKCFYKLKNSKTFCDTFKERIPNNIIHKDKNLTLVASSTNVGQIEIVVNKIKQEIHEHEYKSTAIVLPNEDLLEHLLIRLNEENIDYNSSKGTSIKNTAIFKFIEKSINLSMFLKENASQNVPHEIIYELLHHKYVYDKSFNEDFLYPNRSLTIDDYKNMKIPVLDAIFNMQQSLLSYIKNLIAAVENKKTKEKINSDYLDNEGIKLIKKIVSDLLKNNNNNFLINRESFKFFKFCLSKVRIKEKEILENAVSVLGILETRCLDFEHIYIISANDGVFPPKKNNLSFIPYSLRKGYGLPTYDTFQEPYYAYLFYRMLQSPKKITFTYNKSIANQNTGEKSRYLVQLENNSNIILNKSDFIESLNLKQTVDINIEKDSPILNKIKDNFLKKLISASAINTYIDCQLKYFYKYILRVRNDEEDFSDNMVFGKILHQTLEEIYKNKNTITINTIKKIQDNLEDTIDKILIFNNYTIAIPNEIIKKLLFKIVTKILEIDKKNIPFEIDGIEVGKKNILSRKLLLDNSSKITIFGIIDRIDTKENFTRIIDYKSGNLNLQISDISSLFDRNKNNRNAVALQILLYTWLYNDKTNNILTPLIYGIRNIFKNSFSNYLYIKNKDSQYIKISDTKPYLKDFEKNLKNILSEIIDPNINFSQTENYNTCLNCEYKNICRR